MPISITQLPKSPCPFCGRVNDAATDTTTGRNPGPGDIALCMSCGAASMYDAQMLLRKPQLGDIDSELSLLIRVAQLERKRVLAGLN